MSQDLTLPPYFPLVRKGCEAAAEAFFVCINEKSGAGGDIQEARSGLDTCRDSMLGYSKCTESSLNDKRLKRPNVLTE